MAISPARSTNERVPLSEPSLRGNEWTYVRECLDTGWVSTAGAFVERFEQVVAERVGVPHAIATVNGTAALHTALQLVGVRPGELVVTSSLSFIAPANAIRYVGAIPVFADAEPRYWQMDVRQVATFLTEQCVHARDGLFHRESGRRVAALLPVHVLGNMVDMAPLVELGDRYGVPIVEDATECLGATYRDRAAGSIGTIGCFSFNGNKIITTGGGGMIATADEALARRARHLTTQAKADPLEYVHDEVGYNYRLPNVLAALGVAQMEQLDEHLRLKAGIAERYRAALADVPGITPMQQPGGTSGIWWMFTVLVDPERFGMTPRTLLQELKLEGIQTRPLWQPLHRSPAHAAAMSLGCPVAELLYERGLTLPCSVGLTAAQQERVTATITSLARGGTA